jgi:hypothetical protein
MVEEEKSLSNERVDPKEKYLYDELLRVYNINYGSGKQGLENNIKTVMKQGLSRKQAIIKIAKEEKIKAPKELRKSVSLMMKCPTCGKEMDSGYFMLIAPRGGSCFWSNHKPGKRKFWGIPKIPKDSIGVITSTSSITEDPGVLRAFRCANCEIIAFEY